MQTPRAGGRDRAESRDAAALRELRTAQPELSPAIDLQLKLLEISRRVLPRISLPAALVNISATSVETNSRPFLTWSLLPIDWTEFRAVLRETVDALERSGNLETGAAQALTAIARDGNRLPVVVEAWFRVSVSHEQDPAAIGGTEHGVDEGALETALSLAFKPFLIRCADAIGPRLSLGHWQRGTCPLCGGEPELAILASAADRLLVCGRCTLRWPYAEGRCPFCENRDPDTLRSFSSSDRVYRLSACDVCHRYVKAYDERHAPRPAMPSVDAIATLPLDALAVQKGYG